MNQAETQTPTQWLSQRSAKSISGWTMSECLTFLLMSEYMQKKLPKAKSPGHAKARVEQRLKQLSTAFAEAENQPPSIPPSFTENLKMATHVINQAMYIFQRILPARSVPAIIRTESLFDWQKDLFLIQKFVEQIVSQIHEYDFKQQVNTETSKEQQNERP